MELEGFEAQRLASLVDDAAGSADDFHDIAAALRSHLESEGEPLRAVISAFEYFPARNGTAVFAPTFQTEGRMYPAPLALVSAEILDLWSAVADLANAPAAQARLNDLLFQRRVGNGRRRVTEAVSGYLALTTKWAPVEATRELLPRAVDLARRVGLVDLSKSVHDAAVKIAEACLGDDDPKPGLGLNILDLLVSDQSEHPAIDRLLARCREIFPDIHTTVRTIRLQRHRASDDAQRRQLDCEMVEAHLATADALQGILRAHHLEQAAVLARDRGLTEHHARAMSARQAIKRDDLGFARISAELSIPDERIEEYIQFYLDALSWQEALIRFGHLLVPSGTVEQNRAAVAEQREKFVLRSILPVVLVGRDGLPRYRPADDEDRFEVELVQNESQHLMFWAAWGVEVLRRIPDKFGEPDADELEAWLAKRPHVSPAVARSIRRALQFFWLGEWEAACAIGVPRVESLVRDLVLLVDEPVYRMQREETPGQYPGLGAMLPILVDHGLDESWFRYLRCAFSHVAGLNLRNEFAHGFVNDPAPTMAVIVCHALVYLALLVEEESGSD